MNKALLASPHESSPLVSWTSLAKTTSSWFRVGWLGAIDSAADMETLFAGIPLGEVTTSMTISGPAVPIFCMYLVADERQGVDPGVLNGTPQTDTFKEYIAPQAWPSAPRPPPPPHGRGDKG